MSTLPGTLARSLSWRSPRAPIRPAAHALKDRLPDGSACAQKTASQTANCGPEDASFQSFWPTCAAMPAYLAEDALAAACMRRAQTQVRLHSAGASNETCGQPSERQLHCMSKHVSKLMVAHMGAACCVHISPSQHRASQKQAR